MQDTRTMHLWDAQARDSGSLARAAHQIPCYKALQVVKFFKFRIAQLHDDHPGKKNLPADRVRHSACDSEEFANWATVNRATVGISIFRVVFEETRGSRKVLWLYLWEKLWSTEKVNEN